MIEFIFFIIFKSVIFIFTTLTAGSIKGCLVSVPLNDVVCIIVSFIVLV